MCTPLLICTRLKQMVLRCTTIYEEANNVLSANQTAFKENYDLLDLFLIFNIGFIIVVS
jgi:hypothetical protein